MGCILCGRIVMACAECAGSECHTPLCRECKSVAAGVHEDPIRVGTALDSRRVVYLPEE